MNAPADISNLHPEVARAYRRAASYVSPRGARVVLAEPLGEPIYFCVNNRNDRIHKNHLRGQFYEQDVLGELAEHMPDGGTFVDIGANIGNHTLYMAKHGGAGRVIPMEPNPAAIALLMSVVRLNRIEDQVELSALGYGLGEADAGGFAIRDIKGNLGWARLEDSGGDIEVRKGDTLLADEACVDLIKIDVEGMEIAALSGLQRTIERDQPEIFVEVDHGNREAFDALMDAHSYRCALEFPKSRMNQNFLMEPA
ncbi:hypothetical protein AIOL_001837 [Candidatus Rhodobacter oscarellae]|uniref:Methyltransferase FkbM domain-containing protein n=1 Tax=Candidatus Rhodobacter oscarellae TaxID=1675527 RepID=A0A0J9E2C0_9RHOB|nr:FkbM family methyltransferase [Candidatus Rhodobacter lobularis]KMW56880.1 hypothetical protein AIOL_001837 [Candidatus Rhodobacter lobularis]